MNRKNYLKPVIRTVKINTNNHLLTGTTGSKQANTVGGNVFNSGIKGGAVDARSRSFDDWDDEE